MTSSARPLSDLTVMPRPFDHDDAKYLVHELFDEQMRRYGFADPPEVDLADFVPPSGLFLVAYVASEPVACGGVRLEKPGVAEIKKMYVRPGRRGLGIGRRILSELEESARAAGIGHLILETGIRNSEALVLYGRTGYTPIPAYRDRDPEFNRALTKNLAD